MSKRASAGDDAVDGLLGGILAGVAMGLYLVLAGLATGDSPSEVLGLFSPSGNGDPLLGSVAHLAVSAIYGAAFGLILRISGGRLAPSAAGLVYGVLLYLLANYIILPQTDSAMLAFTSVNLSMAHILYGLVLGYRMKKRQAADTGS